MTSKSIWRGAALGIALGAGVMGGAMTMAKAPHPAMATGGKAIPAAIASPDRPEADKSRDEARKPADLLVFARVHPGMKVGELLPGGGYFTRMLSKVVGEKGAVYSWIPDAASAKSVGNFAVVKDIAYTNVSLVRGATFSAPEKLDLVWTSQNYHDLHHHGGNAEATNTAAFDALKPGGLYFVTDHAARAGSGTGDTDTMHRIDPDYVKAEVAKAGFKFVGSSKALANASDDHTQSVFKIHDHTDQFVFLFMKPRK
jgi:predicted methyltransferase